MVQRARKGHLFRNALGPYPDYRPSDVEWLDEIPSHWTVKRLKYSSRTIAGQSPPSEVVFELPGGLPFLQGNAEFGAVRPAPRLACDKATKRAFAGDILLSVRAPVGAINVADQSYGIGRGLCAIQPNPGLDGRFAYYLILSEVRWLHRTASGSTYDGVTAGDIGNLLLIYHPSPNNERSPPFWTERQPGSTRLWTRRSG